jgi:hypothetical protein
MNRVMEYLIKERRLQPKTLEAFGVVEEGGGATFPYPSGRKMRRHDDQGRRKFVTDKGWRPSLWGMRTSDKVAFLVEGETDAMRLYQEFDVEDEVSPTVLAVPGINTWNAEWAEELRDKDTVICVLDNDPDYMVRATVDKAFTKMATDIGRRKVRRIHLPDGVKDLCEFFDNYTLDTLRMLADRKDGNWHYQALDLTVDPGEPDWFLEKFLAKGDRVLMAGDSGIGKTWVHLALAVAVAEGRSHFLGRELSSRSRRVLVVDEENPSQLVRYRVNRLSLTEAGAKNIRYLNNQGVRMDKNPEPIIEEALAFDPSLIILDALTRFHTKDENSAGEISALFNDAINPLAHETGATTLVVHHANKGDGSSLSRVRGSTDITASVDSGIDVRKAADGSNGVNLILYKSRWTANKEIIRAELREHENYAELVERPEMGIMF